MMKIRYLVIFFLILIGAGNIIYVLRIRKNMFLEICEYSEQIKKKDEDYQSLRNQYFIELKYNSYKIDSTLILISPKGDRVRLNDIISKKPKFIFLFSKFTCNSCIKSELIRLKNYQSYFSPDDIVFLTNYENTRDLYMFSKLNKIPYPVYRCQGTKFVDLELFTQNWPYYFIVNEDLTIQDLHVIDANSPSITKDYLDILIGKYFDN